MHQTRRKFFSISFLSLLNLCMLCNFSRKIKMLSTSMVVGWCCIKCNELTWADTCACKCNHIIYFQFYLYIRVIQRMLLCVDWHLVVTTVDRCHSVDLCHNKGRSICIIILLEEGPCNNFVTK